MNPTVRVILAKHNGDYQAARDYCLRLIQEYHQIARDINVLETAATLKRSAAHV